MPVCEFYECSKGHITEKTFSTSEEAHKKHRCRFNLDGKLCNALAEITYIHPRKGRNALAFKPIEFYTNDKGEVINIGYSIRDLGSLPNKVQKKIKKYINKLERKGYSHKEIISIRQYEQFRREQNLIRTSDNLTEKIQSDIALDNYLKNEADDIKRGFMMTRADGSRVSIPPLDRFDHPEIAQLARDLMENRPIDQDLLRDIDSQIARDIRDINSSTPSIDAGFYINAIDGDNR